LVFANEYYIVQSVSNNEIFFLVTEHY
jgi:hypothetical protein